MCAVLVSGRASFQAQFLGCSGDIHSNIFHTANVLRTGWKGRKKKGEGKRVEGEGD